MKNLLKRFVAICALFTMLSSCGVLNQTASQGISLGNSTGSSLASIIKILKATGALDLSNLGNIINLGQILTGASSLQNATSAFTSEFASGLINGSSNMVNQGNVNAVMSALKSLANTNTTAIQTAASAAYSGQQTQLSTSTAGVSETLAVLNTISNLVK
jgi:hypothetical protein